MSATLSATAPVLPHAAKFLPAVSGNVRYFLDLARAGQWPTSSSGERAAALLYNAVLDHLPALDASAVDGLLDWIALAVNEPQTAASLIDPGTI